ncbi:hypothetical protein CGCS363_v011415 [Colletotrichum siamense]|uniref:uncharacterized protein n=1 Tax=Colletotrichum siamense TaxID=690259 RepID=UPI0018732164|nr:uncharacterized protein CGCS363_v011415 [Colletotrichum siamense]KAF5491738.1 hypothetical protein CGCS363_v011415 [Colletotrichum siamense]
MQTKSKSIQSPCMRQKFQLWCRQGFPLMNANATVDVPCEEETETEREPKFQLPGHGHRLARPLPRLA